MLPSSIWPMYQFESDHNAVFEQPEWRTTWHASVGDKINGGLAIVGDTLYVTSFDHYLYALSALSGALEWKAPLANVSMSTPIIENGLAIVGTGTNAALTDTYDRLIWGKPGGDYIEAINTASGRIAWYFATPGEDMPSPVYYKDTHQEAVIFSNGDDHIRALDPRTGRLLWQQTMFGVSTMSSLNLYDGAVFGLFNESAAYIQAVEHDRSLTRLRSRLWSIRPSDGQYLWMVPYGNSDCSPTIANGTVFVETDQLVHDLETHVLDAFNTVYAVDVDTGRIKWSYQSATGPYSSKGTNEQSVAGVTSHGVFYESLPYERAFAAFDGRTGKVLWKIATSGPVKMSAVDRSGRLYFGDTEGRFYVVNDATGDVVTTKDFEFSFSCSPPVIVGTTLFVCAGKTVYALNVNDLSS